MSVPMPMPFKTIAGPFGTCRIVDLLAAAGGIDRLAQMPWCHRVLLENVLRQPDDERRSTAVAALLGWTGHADAEIDFQPLRILMHDTTCGPALVDIAAMRDCLAAARVDPGKLNPAVPVATSTDHSVAIDHWAVPDALVRNMSIEMARNAERYRFMKWAAAALDGFRVFPPGTGIMHTINLERLATVIATQTLDGETWAMPDTLVGTDSHTPMVNGIGVLGWGVGGIEAEGVMFGLTASLRVPDVVGVRLTGALPHGSSATDLALVVTERLRSLGISGEFVEYFGPGVASLSAGERAVVANMAPEYGATTGCFPIDGRTLAYLCETGRPAAHVALVEAYARENGLWFDPDAAPGYTSVVDISLDAVRPSLSGPRRPQDRFDASDAPRMLGKRRTGGTIDPVPASQPAIPHDAVAIAAITSCTNTTDTGLLVTAGLLARNARRKGLKPPSWVKTSLAPGSPAAGRRLARAGVLDDLEALGFSIAAYGCTTCIGNAGPLAAATSAAVESGAAMPYAVLSGNRNFPGRVHAQIDSALLASPALVVAFALAGHAHVDITADPIGTDALGQPVRLRDLWPGPDEIAAAIAAGTDPSDVASAAAQAERNGPWQALDAPTTPCFPWDPASTYLRPPPFVRKVAVEALDPSSSALIAHPLLVLDDDITTDHISPAGAIPPHSDAGRWLVERGENPRDLNVYAARRGNFEVMVRGLFTNRTVKNRLFPDGAPGETVFAPTGEHMQVWQAAQRYEAAALPVVIVAGERYGAGSSRDWAAKGAQMLGARAVLANSFERIHRANLVGMGVLPVQLPEGWHPSTLDLRSGDRIEIDPTRLAPRAEVPICIRRREGTRLAGVGRALLDTRREVALIRAGGIISYILDRTLQS